MELVFRGVGLFCGAVALHLDPPSVVDVPPGRGLPLQLLQPDHRAAAAVAAGTHGDLSDSGQRRKPDVKTRQKEAGGGK